MSIGSGHLLYNGIASALRASQWQGRFWAYGDCFVAALLAIFVLRKYHLHFCELVRNPHSYCILRGMKCRSNPPFSTTYSLSLRGAQRRSNPQHPAS